MPNLAWELGKGTGKVLGSYGHSYREASMVISRSQEKTQREEPPFRVTGRYGISYCTWLQNHNIEVNQRLVVFFEVRSHWLKLNYFCSFLTIDVNAY